MKLFPLRIIKSPNPTVLTMPSENREENPLKYIFENSQSDTHGSVDKSSIMIYNSRCHNASVRFINNPISAQAMITKTHRVLLDQSQLPGHYPTILVRYSLRISTFYNGGQLLGSLPKKVQGIRRNLFNIILDLMKKTCIIVDVV